MALTYTPNAELGSLCPSFVCKAVDGKTYTLGSFDDATVLCFLFICNHCPYVQAIEKRLIALAHELTPQGITFVGICSNDASEYPEDSFEEIQKSWKEKKYDFPYLYDEDQILAKSFGAICTPDIFVYNKDRKLTYRGRFDDSWKNPDQVQRQELKLALEATLKNQELGFTAVPSMGCSIKWK